MLRLERSGKSDVQTITDSRDRRLPTTSDLGPGFLARVRTASLVLGGLLVLALAVYAGYRPAGAAAAGLAVSVTNLRLLQALFTRMLTPGQRSAGTIALLLLAKVPLLLGSTWVALGPLHLPATWYAIGFSLVLAVVVLKVLGLLLTGMRGRDGRWSWPGRPLLTALAALGALGGTVSLALAEEGGGSKVPELPNIFELLHEAFPDAGWAKWLFHWQNPLFSTLVILVLCVIAAKAYRKREMIPGPLQNAVEAVVEAFSNFILGILGPRGREFVPFLGTLFLYIWWNNLLGLVPFGKSPTSVFTTTASLGICVFCYVQYTGITKLGPWGYIHHLLGSPQDVIGWCMVPLMLPLHLIEEVAKPLSLSLRLFGNIMGEDVLLGVFAMLGVGMLAFLKLPPWAPIGIPLHLPFIFLAVLLSTIQALVFTLLSTIYFLQMLPHEHEEEEHGPARGH
jgi:F-type H+-transporting ATPase subunit a